jgi:hypothetical protein
MTTSEQRPPVSNGQPKPGQTKINSNFQCKLSKEPPPMAGGGGRSLLTGLTVPKKIKPLITSFFLFQHVSGAGDGHALQTTASPSTKQIIHPNLTSSARYHTIYGLQLSNSVTFYWKPFRHSGQNCTKNTSPTWSQDF